MELSIQWGLGVMQRMRQVGGRKKFRVREMGRMRWMRSGFGVMLYEVMDED